MVTVRNKNATTHQPLKCISKSQGGTMLRVLGAARKREVKATQNLSIIVLFFMLCWMPLYTINCIKAFCPDCYIPPMMTFIFIILSHLNSAVNPLLYAYHLKDFRAALQSIICNMLGIKMTAQQSDINYRFSIHSQKRITNLFDKRVSSLQQPRKYIGILKYIYITFVDHKLFNFSFPDSPVWLRQQAQSDLVAAAAVTSESPPPVSAQNPNGSDIKIWQILQVSTETNFTIHQNDELSNNVQRGGNGGSENVCDYTFNYDYLDMVEHHKTNVSTALLLSPSNLSRSAVPSDELQQPVVVVARLSSVVLTKTYSDPNIRRRCCEENAVAPRLTHENRLVSSLSDVNSHLQLIERRNKKIFTDFGQRNNNEVVINRNFAELNMAAVKSLPCQKSQFSFSSSDADAAAAIHRDDVSLCAS